MKSPLTRYAEVLLGAAATDVPFIAQPGNGCMSFTQPRNVHLILYPEDIAKMAALNAAEDFARLGQGDPLDQFPAFVADIADRFAELYALGVDR
jgi:hypothetical protein